MDYMDVYLNSYSMNSGGREEAGGGGRKGGRRKGVTLKSFILSPKHIAVVINS